MKQDATIMAASFFFFGGKTGLVCLADDTNYCADICKVGGSIKSLLYYEQQTSIIIITSALLLVQFKISLNEKQQVDRKVKLSISGDPERIQTIWIGGCLMATCCHENLVRMWHLEEDENYILSYSNGAESSRFSNDKLTKIVYSKQNKLLIAGTMEGRLIFWKNMYFGNESPTETDQWTSMPQLDLTS